MVYEIEELKNYFDTQKYNNPKYRYYSNMLNIAKKYINYEDIIELYPRNISYEGEADKEFYIFAKEYIFIIKGISENDDTNKNCISIATMKISDIENVEMIKSRNQTVNEYNPIKLKISFYNGEKLLLDIKKDKESDSEREYMDIISNIFKYIANKKSDAIR